MRALQLSQIDNQNPQLMTQLAQEILNINMSQSGLQGLSQGQLQVYLAQQEMEKQMMMSQQMQLEMQEGQASNNGQRKPFRRNATHVAIAFFI